MARAERRAATAGAALRPGLALVRGVVAHDDDGSPVATVAVTQMLTLSTEGPEWRECAPRSRHARPFALTLEDGAVVRVDAAEEAWVTARSERVTARSEGCESRTAIRRGRGGGTTDTYEVTRFRLPSGAVVRDRGCWEAWRDRSVRITRDTPPELASDQAPEELSLGGLLWLAFTLGVPGVIFVLEGDGSPWYRTRRHGSST